MKFKGCFLYWLLYVFSILFIFSNICYSMTYTGDSSLCVINVSGDKICLVNGDSFSIDDNQSYYFVLEYESHSTSFISMFDYIKTFIMFSLAGIILLVLVIVVIREVF